MPWLAAVSALTPHLLLKRLLFFYIDNAKAPNITNLHKLVANHIFFHELRYFFLLLCCRPVSSKDFVINLQLIWRKRLCSNPGRIVTIRTAVLLTNSEVRISIVSCIICNVEFMATKSWKIVILAVRGVMIVAVYVIFEISITVVVL